MEIEKRLERLNRMRREVVGNVYTDGGDTGFVAYLRPGVFDLGPFPDYASPYLRFTQGKLFVASRDTQQQIPFEEGGDKALVEAGIHLFFLLDPRVYSRAARAGHIDELVSDENNIVVQYNLEEFAVRYLHMTQGIASSVARAYAPAGLYESRFQFRESDIELHIRDAIPELGYVTVRYRM